MAEILRTEDGGTIWILSKEESTEMRCVLSDSSSLREKVLRKNFITYLKCTLNNLGFGFYAADNHKPLEGYILPVIEG